MKLKILERWGLAGGWARELVVAAATLAFGFGILPALIFWAGSASLGRYEGASLGGVYDGVFGGLQSASAASWIVVLGPYGLYLLFKALRLWWTSSVRLAGPPPTTRPG